MSKVDPFAKIRALAKSGDPMAMALVMRNDKRRSLAGTGDIEPAGPVAMAPTGVIPSRSLYYRNLVEAPTAQFAPEFYPEDGRAASLAMRALASLPGGTLTRLRVPGNIDETGSVELDINANVVLPPQTQLSVIALRLEVTIEGNGGPAETEFSITGWDAGGAFNDMVSVTPIAGRTAIVYYVPGRPSLWGAAQRSPLYLANNTVNGELVIPAAALAAGVPAAPYTIPETSITAKNISVDVSGPAQGVACAFEVISRGSKYYEEFLRLVATNG